MLRFKRYISQGELELRQLKSIFSVNVVLVSRLKGKKYSAKLLVMTDKLVVAL